MKADDSLRMHFPFRSYLHAAKQKIQERSLGIADSK